MKTPLLFLSLIAAAVIAAASSGCGASGPAPEGASGPPVPPNGTPAPNLLYVDHNGTFYIYRLPLAQGSKPERTLTEWPGLTVAPVIAADQFGNVAVASPNELRLFQAPIRSFAPSRAKLRLKLTPAITAIGTSGDAALVDLEYDPNGNLWLFNNVGPGITELRAPVTQVERRGDLHSLRRSRLEDGRFHVADSRTLRHQRDALRLREQHRGTAARTLVQVRLSVRQAARIAWHQSGPSRLRGLKPVAADGGKRAVALARTVYRRAALAQTGRTAFAARQRDQPVRAAIQSGPGLFPNEHANTIVGALAADTYRYSFYTLDAGDGALDVWDLPMRSNAKAKLSLPCLAGQGNCGEKGEHVFLAP